MICVPLGEKVNKGFSHHFFSDFSRIYLVASSIDLALQLLDCFLAYIRSLIHNLLNLLNVFGFGGEIDLFCHNS